MKELGWGCSRQKLQSSLEPRCCQDAWSLGRDSDILLLASQSPARRGCPPSRLPSGPSGLRAPVSPPLRFAFPLGSRKPFLQGCGQCWELGRARDGEPWSCACLCSAQPHVSPLSSLHLAFFIWGTGWPWPPALPLSQGAGQGTPQSHAPVASPLLHSLSPPSTSSSLFLSLFAAH